MSAAEDRGAWARYVRVALARRGGGRLLVDEHLSVSLPAPRPWPALADVLVAPGTGHGAADALAADHPGTSVVAVYREGSACWVRVGPYGRDPIRLTLTSRHTAVCPWPVWASLAHAWLVAGVPVQPVVSSWVVLSSGKLASETPASKTPVSEVLSPEVPSSPSTRSRARTPSAGSGRPTAT